MHAAGNDQAWSPPASPGQQSASRRRRPIDPRRVALRVLIVAAILALVGWGLDWAARIGAESFIARSIQHAEHLEIRPDVKVRGWFFLPQVVTGNYGEVDVTVVGVQDGPLRLARVSAQLYGVHVPLHDVVTLGVSAVPVDRTHETAILTYRDLDNYLAAQGRDMTVSAGPPGQLRITAHTSVFGRTVAVSADAEVKPAPGRLDIIPTSLDTGAGSLDSASQLLLGQRLTIEIPTAPLPFGQQVTAIRPGPHALTVDAAGHDVVLSRPNS